MRDVVKELQKGMKPQAKRMRAAIREEMEIWERSIEQKYGILRSSKRKKNESNRQKA